MNPIEKNIKIVLIGAGRVGYHLGLKFFKEGFEVLQVFSRNIEKAISIAEVTDSQPINDLKQVNLKAQLYVLAVSDDAISEVVESLSETLPKSAFLVHTSGATPSKVFKPYFSNHGILYPLQSFSFENIPDFNSIPICIYSPSHAKVEFLKMVGLKISPHVFEINDEQRAILHVAAVFVNNFTNHLVFIAEKILEKENISLEILYPLLYETVLKLKSNSPGLMQTGPAIRGDQKTIIRHQKYLEEFPEFEKIYSLLTESIRQNL